MSISDADQEHLSQLLMQDTAATLGRDFASSIRRRATNQRNHARDLDDYMQRVVDDVQQEFHDTYVDTTWPRCPRHPHHPLWFRDGWWRCERDDVAVAKLGELVDATGRR